MFTGSMRVLLPAVACAAALLFFFAAVDRLDEGQGAEARRQLEEAIRRGCVACYAAEGIYPPDLDYLKDHYGVQADGGHYTVFYRVFANNLMPDITVTEAAP